MFIPMYLEPLSAGTCYIAHADDVRIVLYIRTNLNVTGFPGHVDPKKEHEAFVRAQSASPPHHVWGMTHCYLGQEYGVWLVIGELGINEQALNESW
jgi:hypothetical protein